MTPDPQPAARSEADALLTGNLTLEQIAQGPPSNSPAAAAAAASAPKAPPVVKPPVVTRTPPADRKFPCKACGARLDFDPASRALKCPYCGYLEAIDPSQARVQEYDFEASLRRLGDESQTIAGRSSEVRCPGCGAVVLLDDTVATEKCPFCATHLENAAPQQAQGQIQPQCILPFAVTSPQAVACFNRWIAGLWFAPSNLRQLANLGQLSGIYVPFWTYDSMTYTRYTGQRGDDRTEYYTTRGADGKEERRSRTVTDWTWVSGEVDHFFDDVLVCASRSLPTEYVDKLEPWDLQDLGGFRPEFLSGFKTERYVVGLGEGFGIARQTMDTQIRRLCCRDIGGDHQRLHSVETQHVGVTFKHILLPIWLAVYRYNNQTYRILVNARTGEVVGSRPYSWIKITLTVLAVLAAILAVAAFVMAARSQ